MPYISKDKAGQLSTPSEGRDEKTCVEWLAESKESAASFGHLCDSFWLFPNLSNMPSLPGIVSIAVPWAGWTLSEFLSLSPV